MRLGQRIEVYVDETGTVVSETPTDTYIRACVVGISKTDKKAFVVGWKDYQPRPLETYKCVDDIDAVNGDEDNYRWLSTLENFTFFDHSSSFAYNEPVQSYAGTVMKKLAASFKEENTDAMWRQGVENAIAWGQAKVSKEVSSHVGIAQGKGARLLLESEVGKHALAFVMGMALQAVPSEDTRISRLGKELRIFGLEYVSKIAIKYVKSFTVDVVSGLPLTSAANTKEA